LLMIKIMCIFTLNNVYILKIQGMRTNIVINDDLMREATELTGLRTKKGVVEEALKLLIRMRRQNSIRKLRGKLYWNEDLEQMRLDK